MSIVESAKIRNKQTLMIDMAASGYIAIFYMGTIQHERQFVWNELEVTEGGGTLHSYLLTLGELMERIDKLTSGSTRKHPAIIEYLLNK